MTHGPGFETPAGHPPAVHSRVVQSPVVQSIGIGFRVLYAAVAVLAGAWAASNWRQVPADSQAVILRFGAITGVQPAGLAAAWPRPIGQIAMLPGPERLLTVRTTTTAQAGGLQDVFTAANSAVVPDGAGSYLTGDGGVVLLGAVITYQVGDGAAYYLAEPHVPQALLRLFQASAASLAATRPLDDFLVAQTNADEATLARRQAIRGALEAAMNARLAQLAAAGAGLGVVVGRIDLEPALPPTAKIAFDGVLVAAQMAEQGIADARTEATRTRQEADRQRDQLLAAAHASGDERVGEARVRTGAVAAIEASLTAAARPAVLDQIYRDQLALVLHRAGRIMAVDAQGGRVLLPAALPGAGP